jgi:transposase-like protein
VLIIENEPGAVSVLLHVDLHPRVADLILRLVPKCVCRFKLQFVVVHWIWIHALYALEENCRHRPVQYLNNVLEQDHWAIKRRVRASQHFR